MIDTYHFSERRQLTNSTTLPFIEQARLLHKHDRKLRHYSRFVYRSRGNRALSFAPLDCLLKRRRLQAVGIVSTTCMAGAAALVTASALIPFTPAGTMGRVRRLYRVARRTRGLLLGVRAGREGRQHRQRRRVNAQTVPTYLNRAAQYYGRRFVSQVAENAPISPLVFQRPILRVIKTELMKKQDFVTSVAEREVRFKFTAQYLDAITKYIPALMTQMFSNRIRNHKLISVTYPTARYLVRNLY
jgi:hypothetical protein